ncbi:rab-protein geranylgeranyltransferase [Phanerochaete sordida]|uniref:Geranylgeranyl transferase type-2 subunit alpha n=1 Tax=Phanerochaete sordida TaxID=48140 RepID=A0A9P3G293_9APHY|nr:rab-protein geranylgeranyltransferase [Phanerochaete sordida]
MHGVKRVRYSKEALEAKREREQAKLKEYLALTGEVLSRKQTNDLSREAFDETTRLLRVNPEFYTVWNYRRQILERELFPKSSASDANDLLAEDLNLTTALLKQHPKVYWIWNHRRWCLEQVPDGPTEDDSNGWRMANWNKELFVVEKMLEADARNFHAWNYRRYVLATMPVRRSELSELAYTKRKIEANFSNFSAWHQRSKVLATLWENNALDPVKSKEDEYDLVKNAMYTDPGDQSVWIYHRWLVGEGESAPLLRREIESIQELLDEQPDSKWCMESLVHYKRLLLQKHGDALTSEERASLVEDCAKLLGELQTLDPARRQRYKELSESIGKL